MSIEDFLSRLKLDLYIENLKLNGINNLNDITEESLVRCNIEKIGHRKRILTELKNIHQAADNNMSVENVDDINEDAPQLPPKRSFSVKNNRTPPIPPQRSLSTTENYHTLTPLPPPLNDASFPPIPPRTDRGEPNNNINATIIPQLPPSPPRRTDVVEDTRDLPDTSILLNFELPPPPPIPVPRVPKPMSDAKVIPVVNIEEDTTEINNDSTSQSEDDPSEDESTFPNDELDSEAKTETLSLLTDKIKFERLLSENTLQRTASGKLNNRVSRFLALGRSGYLHKRGGQEGNKAPSKRYVEFDGKTLKYFKEKGSDPKQTIPLSRMIDVQTEPQAKKPTFHLVTPNRKFTFFDNNGNLTEVSLWMQCLMEAIIHKPKNESSKIGGEMADPEMEGWLLKQGHGVLNQDFEKRYVAIKDNKFCYYRSFDHFEEGLPINTLMMNLASLKEELPKRRLILCYHTQKNYVFEAQTPELFEQWKDAIESAIEKAYGDDTVLNKLLQVESNTKCADCGSTKNVNWASIKCLVITCKKCCGQQRGYSQKFFIPRSILMDIKIWKDDLVELFKLIGNENANKLWAAKLPPDEAISPNCSVEQRITFMKEKYIDKKYFKLSEYFGLPDDLGLALRKNVVTEDVIETLRLLQSGASVMYIPEEESEDPKTPYELAKEAGMTLQMALLEIYKGNMNLVEWKQEQEEEATRAEEQVKRLPQIPDDNTEYYEKSGQLMMKMNEKENWRDPRLFQLKGRKLERSSKTEDGTEEVIDLKQVEKLNALNDHVTFFLQTNANNIIRTYYFKAFTPEDCRSWFSLIKNKQVFEVPLDKQELSPNKIPYLVDKCIEYLEKNALTDLRTLTQEGIYRKSGSQQQIRRLSTLFNQDAASVRLDIEEYYDAHVITGLFKKYLRDLPEPLLTNTYYNFFIDNTNEQIPHNERLYRYRDLIKGLPEVNQLCLRALILHLHLVTELSDSNKMTVENVSLLLGPSICSCLKTLDQSILRKEYKVLTDLLTYYDWLFDVDENEKNIQEVMISTIGTIGTIVPPPSSITSGIQITFYVGDTEDQMKVDSSTKPADVCNFFIKKHSLSVTICWALFESINNEIFERPVYSKESVYDLAISLSDNGKLVVKENYLLEKLAPHQSASFNNGAVVYYSVRGTTWKKWFLEIKQGTLHVYSKKGSSKEEDKFCIHEAQALLYHGIDPKKKPPAKFGFMIKVNGTVKDSTPRYFCSDSEDDINMFMAVILNIRYPVGIWTDRISKEFTETEVESNRNSQFWGRQSMVIHPRGISTRFADQLQTKRGTLKKFFK